MFQSCQFSMSIAYVYQYYQVFRYIGGIKDEEVKLFDLKSFRVPGVVMLFGLKDR